MTFIAKELENPMRLDYFTYRSMTEKLFYGIALTDQHMTTVSRLIFRYLADNGVSELIQNGMAPEFGKIQLVERMSDKGTSARLCIDGEEMTIRELESIGYLLPHGMIYKSREKIAKAV